MKRKFLFCFFMGFAMLVFAKTSDKTDINHPIKNVDYETLQTYGIDYWGKWGRTAAALKTAVKTKNGTSYYELSYSAKDDYCVNFASEMAVQEGDIYLITMEVLVYTGKIGCSFITRDKDNKVINWIASTTENTEVSPENKKGELQTIYSLLAITENDGIAKIQPRVVGTGEGKFQIKSISFQKLKGFEIQKTLSIENDLLKVDCSCENAAFDVLDKRNGKKYLQSKDSLGNLLLINSRKTENSINLTFVNLAEKMNLLLSAEFSDSGDTLEYTLSAEDFSGNQDLQKLSMNSAIDLPQKSISQQGDYIVLPENEGMAYDWNDTAIPDRWQKTLVFYSGHGLCMDFYGITSSEDGAGFITIVETPDDAAAVLLRKDTNTVGMEWHSQKQKFGYERKIKQTFLTGGNHVAIAKKYREYARAQGKVVTFEEKIQKRGWEGTDAAENLKKLFGAANIWSWTNEWTGHTPATLAKKMMDAGMDKILWSTRQSEKVVKQLNELGILVGAYDIYQDIMPEENFDQVKSIDEHSWKPYAYPDCISTDKNGNFVTAWGVSKKDDSGYLYCLNLCDMTAPAIARKVIGDEQKTTPFGARFLDTTTASNLRECYSPKHPMTRTQSRLVRGELFRVVTEENNLVCGSETGMDWAIPDCDYFEGMLSIGPYRCSKSGRDIQNVYETAEPQILEFQLNEKRRLPLFELVYHDCCVAMWYWDDTNNKFADVMDKRDCFNALYACPPMYWVYNDKFWDQNGDKIIRSYKHSSEIVQAAAGLEMINHEYLSKDRSIQRTTFANGIQVTVNFNTNEIKWEK